MTGQTGDSSNAPAVLLEIGTEEIPARFLPDAITAMKDIAGKLLDEYRIGFQDLSVYATPRRLAVMIHNIAPVQRDLVKEVFGPSRKAAFDEQGNPTKAAEGFANSTGVRVSDLRIKQKGKGEYVVAVVEEKGADAKTVLPEVLQKIVLSLHFPKSMRWGNGSVTFVRPIVWMLAVYGPEKIEFEIDGMLSSNQTRGHRFLSPASFQIRDASSYMNFLETNFVILDQNKRKNVILKSMAQLFQDTDAQVVADETLLETVSYLVEYPVPVLCGFSPEYLRLPRELLITVMRDHQKYFAVQDGNGNLMSRFVVISNTKAENAEAVRVGAERVIKARFDDAQFYFREDTTQKLEDRVESLKDVTFHDQLGSLFDKTDRISALAGFIAEKVAQPLRESAVRAARLSKTDLVTGVVREFPELQGVMGKYYAHHDGEDRNVADALEEQYLPKSFGGSLPRTEAGAILSLADRIDSVASFFSIGLIPSGSEDPFALRRQAMGVVSILLDRGYALSLNEVFARAIQNLNEAQSSDSIMENIAAFMGQRIEFILSSIGQGQEAIKSVISLAFAHPLHTITARIAALEQFRKEEVFPDFLLAIKRVNNIIPKTSPGAVRPALLKQDEERNLHAAFSSAKGKVTASLEKDDWHAAAKALSEMTAPINAFFDKVLVMDKDEGIKENRISLLQAIWQTASLVADFSKFPS
jgi:glycyl-tRNA synthetase beta chain